ncbi:MAG: SpoIIE family protein phosphatase [Gemmatimonadetes bacterium]|nr:SpoIIE family protein phosphatase [Gemmatimonadota bacterium]
MKDLHQVILGFTTATGLPAVVWTTSQDGGGWVVAAGTSTTPAPGVLRLLTAGMAPAELEVPGGLLLISATAGTARAWVGIGPCDPRDRERAIGALAFLAPVVAHYFQSSLEMEHSAYELAERYEEINLLYTTSEILGRTVSLEDAAARILAEISETVGARRAAILVHDRSTDTLQVLSALGFEADGLPAISTSNPDAVTAFVFREQRGYIFDDDVMPCPLEARFRQGGVLAVPILWTNPGHHPAVPLGVLTLSERRTGEAFSAGDEKLVSAIATQIGTAIQNARLVRSSLAQQRLQQEMSLASDLQQKLLPDARLFAPEAQVAARVVSADSVGGDFYQLFRLGGGRTGIMIGDVSSHGMRAALVMALVMSASSIHAQATADPAEMLSKLLGTLADELESTEMFVTAFYAVIDPVRGRIRYANAGHPHAFVLGADGAVERLGALEPPLGMSGSILSARERPWSPNRDVLLLFTDGIPDARNHQEVAFGEQRVLDLARALREEAPPVVVDRIFSAVASHAGDALRRDDLTLLVARS